MKLLLKMAVPFILMLFINISYAQLRVRAPYQIPDIPGYQTLICDFHIHTVFSDGTVWPSVRAEEAWREGLDAIAITDHIEYLPHKDDIRTNHNRSGYIAKGYGQDIYLTVIRGSEITRDMPPGHLNAIFIQDANKLDVETWQEAIAVADSQEAFIFWNHPGWRGQQKDGVARWYPEHTELLDKGMLHGIEVVNNKEYYPEAHQWCLDKNLTMLSNSDIHPPIQMHYDSPNGDTRPVTLVFAKSKDEAAIKEALFNQRTAVLWRNMLVGKEEFLKPIFNQSVQIENPSITFGMEDNKNVQITNRSDVDFELFRADTLTDITIPEKITLYSGKTVLFNVKKTKKLLRGKKVLNLPYKVQNLLVTPIKPLEINLELEIEQK
jgi:hypothetical protein